MLAGQEADDVARGGDGEGVGQRVEPNAPDAAATARVPSYAPARSRPPARARARAGPTPPGPSILSLGRTRNRRPAAAAAAGAAADDEGLRGGRRRGRGGRRRRRAGLAGSRRRRWQPLRSMRTSTPARRVRRRRRRRRRGGREAGAAAGAVCGSADAAASAAADAAAAAAAAAAALPRVERVAAGVDVEPGDGRGRGVVGGAAARRRRRRAARGCGRAPRRGAPPRRAPARRAPPSSPGSALRRNLTPRGHGRQTGPKGSVRAGEAEHVVDVQERRSGRRGRREAAGGGLVARLRGPSFARKSRSHEVTEIEKLSHALVALRDGRQLQPRAHPRLPVLPNLRRVARPHARQLHLGRRRRRRRPRGVRHTSPRAAALPPAGRRRARNFLGVRAGVVRPAALRAAARRQRGRLRGAPRRRASQRVRRRRLRRAAGAAAARGAALARRGPAGGCGRRRERERALRRAASAAAAARRRRRRGAGASGRSRSLSPLPCSAAASRERARRPALVAGVVATAAWVLAGHTLHAAGLWYVGLPLVGWMRWDAAALVGGAALLSPPRRRAWQPRRFWRWRRPISPRTRRALPSKGTSTS